MKAIILAAGRGSRMGALTDERPKCLAEVKGVPLVEHQLSALRKGGVSSVGIVTGYKSDLLQSYGDKRFHNPRWSQTNMVASLLCAKEWLLESNCIISYSDIYYQPDIISKLIESNESEDVLISYDPDWLSLWSKRFDNPLDDAESFNLDDEGYVKEIGQKVGSLEQIKGQYMGLIVFTSGLWQKWSSEIESLGVDNLYMTDLLQTLIEKGVRVKAVANTEPWFEVDNAHDLEVCNEYV
jgi:choline kinase